MRWILCYSCWNATSPRDGLQLCGPSSAGAGSQGSEVLLKRREPFVERCAERDLSGEVFAERAEDVSCKRGKPASRVEYPNPHYRTQAALQRSDAERNARPAESKRRGYISPTARTSRRHTVVVNYASRGFRPARERRLVPSRRSGLDRRSQSVPEPVEWRRGERRLLPDRRRSTGRRPAT